MTSLKPSQQYARNSVWNSKSKSRACSFAGPPGALSRSARSASCATCDLARGRGCDEGQRDRSQKDGDGRPSTAGMLGIIRISLLCLLTISSEERDKAKQYEIIHKLPCIDCTETTGGSWSRCRGSVLTAQAQNRMDVLRSDSHSAQLRRVDMLQMFTAATAIGVLPSSRSTA